METNGFLALFGHKNIYPIDHKKEERKNFLSEWTVLFSSDDFQVLPPYHPTTANEDDRRKMVKKRLTSKYYIKSAFRGDGSSSNGALRRGDGE